MKIRIDYFTNSSSLSFASIHVSGEKLTEIMNKYKTALETLSANNKTLREESFDKIKSGKPLTETDKNADIWAEIPEFSEDVLYFELMEKIKLPKTKDDIFELFLEIANKLSQSSGKDTPFGERPQDFSDIKDELITKLSKFEYQTHEIYYGDLIGDVVDIAEKHIYEYLGIPEYQEIDENTLRACLIS